MPTAQKSHSILYEGLCLLISYVSSLVILPYLRIGSTPIALFSLTAILYMCHRVFFVKKVRLTQTRTVWIISCFSAVLAVSLLCGKHIQLANTYLVGQPDQNAFSPLELKDIVAFFVLTYGLSIVLYTVFCRIEKNHTPNDVTPHDAAVGLPAHPYKALFGAAFFILVAWLPYFLIYYPGLIFGDSLNSITEALHYAAYENHFPLFYTLFIELCLRIGLIFGSLTLGCAIYTVIQMLYLAFVLSYIVCWLYNKGVPKRLCLFALLIYATMSCFPQHAISMWKDPVFSATVVFYGIKLLDLGLSKGTLAKHRSFLLQLCISALLICLSRNNGIYILIFSFFCILVHAGKNRWLSVIKSAVVLQAACIVGILLLTGPVYNFLNIGKDDIESFGIPLQQLARTVVYDGDISDQDKAFLDHMLPLEKWDDVYTPGLVDNIKWDAEFSKAYFDGHKGEFLAVWFRTFLKNPVRYFESWCLSTYGYWIPNLWELNDYTSNITSGNINALSTWWISLPIYPQNLLHNDKLTSVFSLTTPLPAAGLLTWAMAFLCLWSVLCRKDTGILMFVPIIGNLITLFLAAPSAYWPRYALASFYAIPLILLFPVYMKQVQGNRDDVQNHQKTAR